MSLVIRRHLRTRRRRLLAVAVVALLGAAVWSAHAAPGDHHMGEAAAICLAVAAVAAAGIAAAPRLGRLLPGRPRPPASRAVTRSVLAVPPVVGRARGHPAVLQVFRR
jgi:hypothetical protein